MKSGFTLLAAGVVISLSLAGCGASGDAAGSSGDGSIEVQTGLAVDSKLLSTLKEVTNSFQQANPTVKINLVPNSTTYEKDMKVRLASATFRTSGGHTAGRGTVTANSCCPCRTKPGPRTSTLPSVTP